MPKPAPTLGAALLAVLSVGCGTRTESTASAAVKSESIELEEAKLLIEHNATDHDTGFQLFLDGEPWKDLEVIGPDGTHLLQIRPQNELGRLGFTELFLETNEPDNAEVPIDDILALLPEGSYEMRARSAEDGTKVHGVAHLTHAIPAGPNIRSPVEDAIVDRDALVVAWDPVDKTITGNPVTIVSYEVIVETAEEADPHPDAFAKQVFDVHVAPSVTSLTVSREFLQPGTAYQFEVLAIEDSGNQTLSVSHFATD